MFSYYHHHGYCPLWFLLPSNLQLVSLNKTIFPPLQLFSIWNISQILRRKCCGEHQAVNTFLFCFCFDEVCLYSSRLLHWHLGNRTIAQVTVKQSWRIQVIVKYVSLGADNAPTTNQCTTKSYTFYRILPTSICETKYWHSCTRCLAILHYVSHYPRCNIIYRFIWLW